MSAQVTAKSSSISTQGDCRGDALCRLPVITDGIPVRVRGSAGVQAVSNTGSWNDRGQWVHPKTSLYDEPQWYTKSSVLH